VTPEVRIAEPWKPGADRIVQRWNDQTHAISTIMVDARDAAELLRFLDFRLMQS